jgi:[ribosomal protein S5]-alanine N-acetyltransferase
MNASIALQSPVLETERLIIRMPQAADVPSIVAFYTNNQTHLAPWGPTFPPDFFTDSYWQSCVLQYAAEFENDQTLRLFSFPKDQANIIAASINFTQIVRRAAQFCFLGFASAEFAQGKGLTYEAVGAAIKYVFNEMNLHRVQANYMPHNQRSGALLNRLGFIPEGYARNYLRINGEWRDHVLTSLTNPSWRAPE